MPPSTPLPPPLRGNELGTFTHRSVAVRLPEIATRVVAENQLPPAAADAVAALAIEVGSGTIRPLRGAGPDAAAWDGYVAPYAGMGWLDVPWFFAEYYFYRRILDAVEFWETAADPFELQKQLGLDQAVAPARQTIAATDAAYADWEASDVLLMRITSVALSGNQVDLSLWPATADAAPSEPATSTRLLVDERPQAIRLLADRLPPPIDIVLDNAGAELVADLLLADLLLRSDLASRLRLHAKQYPIFVSDATEADVAATIERFAGDDDRHLRSVGERLQAELTTRRLQISTHPFWVSPLGWRQRPADLDATLAEAGLVIVKGDANFRRLVDDRHWEFTTPLGTAVGGTPAPLLTLRSIKSEVAPGLTAAAVATAAAADPQWMENGRWAMANLVDPTAVALKSTVPVTDTPSAT